MMLHDSGNTTTSNYGTFQGQMFPIHLYVSLKVYNQFWTAVLQTASCVLPYHTYSSYSLQISKVVGGMPMRWQPQRDIYLIHFSYNPVVSVTGAF